MRNRITMAGGSAAGAINFFDRVVATLLSKQLSG
jgi:hypothetical protein